MSFDRQVVLLYGAINGFFEKIPLEQVQDAGIKFVTYLEHQHADLLGKVREYRDLPAELETGIKSAFENFLRTHDFGKK